MGDELEKARANEERRSRRLTMVGLLGGAGVTAGVCGLLLSTQGKGMAAVAGAVMGLLGVAVVVGSFALAGRYLPNGDTIKVENAKGGYRDRVQREHAHQLGFMPIATLLMNFIALRSTWAVLTGEADFHDLVFAATGPLASIMILQLVAGRWRGQDARTKRMLDEELLVSFRRRALNLGFGVAVAGVVLGFAAGLYNPSWGVMSLPIILAVAAAVSAFRYAQLDRQADLHG